MVVNIRRFFIYTLTILISTLLFSPLILTLNCNGLDIGDKTWTTCKYMPTARRNLATVVFEEKIYAIGGSTEMNGLKACDIVECYDPEFNSWTRLADMPTARKTLGCVVVDNKIYAIGGYENTEKKYSMNVSSLIECYDPTTDTWSNKTEMPLALGSFAYAAVKNEIYIMGGNNGFYGEGLVQYTFYYNPFTDTWKNLSNMPSVRSGCTATVIHEEIYVLGGNSVSAVGLPNIEVYNPDKDDWIVKKNMPFNLDRFVCESVNDHIYLIGGTKGDIEEPKRDLYCYDPISETWKIGSKMPTSRMYANVVVLNNMIYVIGGYTEHTGVLTTVECYNPMLENNLRDLPKEGSEFISNFEFFILIASLTIIITIIKIKYHHKSNKI